VLLLLAARASVPQAVAVALMLAAPCVLWVEVPASSMTHSSAMALWGRARTVNAAIAVPASMPARRA
jgi:hypothetical protein